MKIIGFDFGTTNSTVSSLIEIKGIPVPVSFERDADNTREDYIPSVIAYDRNNGDVLIGRNADGTLAAKKYEIYRNFKLRIGGEFDKPSGDETRTSIQATADYIKELLMLYEEDKKLSKRNEKIASIVMTVPAAWRRGSDKSSVINDIERLYSELGYETVDEIYNPLNDNEVYLEREPVAAAAFFCHAYEFCADSDICEDINKYKHINPDGKPYNGSLLVIDFGGGTLDVALCKVEDGRNITILQRDGFGEYGKDTNGCAGVAFDVAVVSKLIADNKLEIEKDSLKFKLMCKDFEKNKRDLSNKITERMKKYYSNPSVVKDPLFPLTYDYDNGEAVEVYCADMDACFEEICATQLRKFLHDMKMHCDSTDYNIDTSRDAERDDFKVLLVGGFSNFVAVEREVRDFFDSNPKEEDRRFEMPFGIRNRSLAISKGAALIAGGWTEVREACEHSYGYAMFARGESDQLIPIEIPVIEKGTKIAEVAKPTFPQERQAIRAKDRMGQLTVYVDGKPVILDKKIGELFPNMDDRNNEYKIDFSVNRYQVLTLHVKDKGGKTLSTQLTTLQSS